MAFTVEDGTGLTNSNSLASVAFANAYFADRAVAEWELLDDEVKTAALIKATDYFELRWSQLLIGDKYKETTQSLSFPRYNLNLDVPIYDLIETTLIIGYQTPIQIQKAICEYAIRSITKPLVKDTDANYASPTRIKVGVIEKETNFTYYPRRPDLYNSFPPADILIKPFLKSSGGRVIR